MKTSKREYSIDNMLFVLFLLFLFTFNSKAQVIFEEGYFIDNNNNKTVCLIKNFEWKNNPTRIEYKLLGSTKTLIGTISNVQEFQVSYLKYRRFTVNVDQSSESMSNLSIEKEPEFKKDTLFLKYIIEGYANLYESPKHNKYFFNINDSAVSQLIYKEYISDNKVAKNNTYISQLFNELKCSSISILDIKNTLYNKKDLIKIFEKYNTCKESNSIIFKKVNKKDVFNLYVRPGLRRATLSVKNSQNTNQNVDFGSKLSFSFGIEAEFVFPFNKNKWAFTIEPTYQYYKAKNPRNYLNDVDYKSIEFPLGIRYYLFLNNNLKLFLSSSFVILDKPISSEIGQLEIMTTNNLNFGFGFNYKNKFSGEVRYGTSRELVSTYTFYTSNYQSLSIIIGYSIF